MITPTLVTCLAYIGPGAGLSALGALLALSIGLMVAFIAFVWYPIRRLRRKWRLRSEPAGSTRRKQTSKP